MTYRNFDSTGPQIPSIIVERVLLPDDSDDTPEDRDEGFWPSRDPDAAGYVGEVSDEQFAEYEAAARDRYVAWTEGAWRYVGVIARAHVKVPIGGGSFTTFTIDSAGLWGVESDAGDYLDDVFAEEKAILLRQLVEIGNAAKTTA